MSHSNTERLNVLSPIQRQDGKTFWLRLGTAFRNKDGSINVYLDALPMNGKLQLRVAHEQGSQGREGSNA